MPGGQPNLPARFATTRWTVVIAAGAIESPQARDALAALAQAYWSPLYGFVRRQGYSPQDAEDLTQGFIAKLIEKRYLEQVDRSKGRFRSFLLSSLRHFLANERDRASTVKRGGRNHIIELDGMAAEARYQLEPATDVTPEKLFDRRWAIELLELVLNRLRDDYRRTGRSAVFDALKGVLQADADSETYSRIATRLSMTETAVKVAVCRLRARYRELLREEVARTVASEDELDEELNDLLNCL